MTALPPLVDASGHLSNAELNRYNRHLILPSIGPVGQQRLKSAKVLVIGAGGLGSPVLLYLAAAGVGTIGIIDFDSVDQSNLQRQIIHGQSDIGTPKAESARNSIAEINDSISVHVHRCQLAAGNAVDFFRQYDLIVDCTDNFPTRYLINDAAEIAHKPHVWGAVYQFEGHTSVFWGDAPNGRDVTYRDLFSTPPPAGLAPSCSEGGVLGVLCASIGSIMATEAIKLITGIGDSLLGRLLIYDALALKFHTIQCGADPNREQIKQLGTYDFPSCDVQPDHGITPTELRLMLDAQADIILIDVREPFEYDANHIEAAKSLPLRMIDKIDEIEWFSHNVSIIVYCQTGVRSAEALKALKAAGFADVRHLLGGIAQWTHIANNLPRTSTSYSM